MKIPTIFDSNNSITLVNLYSQENPLLEIGDECYFLFFNLVDFHIPILGRGKILYDRYNEEINKTYFIQLTELIDSEKVLNIHLYGKQILTNPFNSETDVLSSKARVLKFIREMPTDYFENNLIKVDCFFVRKELKQIKELRQEYIRIMVADFNKQIQETKIFETDII